MIRYSPDGREGCSWQTSLIKERRDDANEIAYHSKIGGMRAVQPRRVVAQLPLKRREVILVPVSYRRVVIAAIVGHQKDEKAENEEGGDRAPLGAIGQGRASCLVTATKSGQRGSTHGQCVWVSLCGEASGMAWLGLRSLRPQRSCDVLSRAYALPSDLSCSPTALLPHPKIPAGALESETFDRRAWCSRRSRRRKRTKIVIPKGLSWAAKRRALYSLHGSGSRPIPSSINQV